MDWQLERLNVTGMGDLDIERTKSGWTCTKRIHFKSCRCDWCHHYIFNRLIFKEFATSSLLLPQELISFILNLTHPCYVWNLRYSKDFIFGEDAYSLNTLQDLQVHIDSNLNVYLDVLSQDMEFVENNFKFLARFQIEENPYAKFGFKVKPEEPLRISYNVDLSAFTEYMIHFRKNFNNPDAKQEEVIEYQTELHNCKNVHGPGGEFGVIFARGDRFHQYHFALSSIMFIREKIHCNIYKLLGILHNNYHFLRDVAFIDIHEFTKLMKDYDYGIMSKDMYQYISNCSTLCRNFYVYVKCIMQSITKINNKNYVSLPSHFVWQGGSPFKVQKKNRTQNTFNFYMNGASD